MHLPRRAYLASARYISLLTYLGDYFDLYLLTYL